MNKPKTTKKAPAKGKAAAKQENATAKAAAAEASATEKKARARKVEEGLCVFAFRLLPAERDAIHKAAGPAGASRFVRSLAVAAATGDEAQVKAIIKALPGLAS